MACSAVCPGVVSALVWGGKVLAVKFDLFNGSIDTSIPCQSSIIDDNTPMGNRNHSNTSHRGPPPPTRSPVSTARYQRPSVNDPESTIPDQRPRLGILAASASDA